MNRTHRHPVATFLLYLLFGPFLLAGALLLLIVYLFVTLLMLGSGNTGSLRVRAWVR